MYHFFWETKSPFSQWHPAQYTVNGIIFNCSEQGMMYEKAILFKDFDIAERILKTSDPKKIKEFGRKVKNFDYKKWDDNKQKIVFTHNFAKFSQNQNLKDALFNTGNKILVEASPYDKIWGIGLRKTDPLAQNKTTWKGLNLLGYIITDVRDKLFSLNNSKADCFCNY